MEPVPFNNETLLASFSLPDLLDIARLPTAVDGGLCRCVKPENGEEAAFRNGRKPVGLLALGCFRADIDVSAAVFILRGLVELAERGERLSVVQTGRILRFIKRHRPKQFGRDILR